MTNFELVNEKLRNLQYMRESQAVIMRDFIHEHDVRSILEIGFYKGKSTAYFAAILEDLGEGHVVTIDKEFAQKYEPNISETLDSVGLSHRVTSIFAHRSHTWELGKLASEAPKQQFDMCYFDGGHTWDVTGFGFVLVDMLLRPGGWIVFDDLDWTITKSLKRNPSRAKSYRNYSQDEKDACGVRMVFELLAPSFGYKDLREDRTAGWGFARKPNN
jgi:predicted O-methyltransferase YrrM